MKKTHPYWHSALTRTHCCSSEKLRVEKSSPNPSGVQSHNLVMIFGAIQSWSKRAAW